MDRDQETPPKEENSIGISAHTEDACPFIHGSHSPKAYILVPKLGEDEDEMEPGGVAWTLLSFLQ